MASLLPFLKDLHDAVLEEGAATGDPPLLAPTDDDSFLSCPETSMEAADSRFSVSSPLRGAQAFDTAP